MSEVDRQVREIIRELQAGLERTVEVISSMPEQHIDRPSAHGCARGGTVWNLLTHNIEHDRMHTGQVIGVRDDLRILQQDRRSRLLAELCMERARLIASLYGLTDDQLDTAPNPDSWSIRETVEHVLHWEKDSMQTLASEIAAADQTVS